MISLTASVLPLHSGVRGMWLQWARGALDPIVAEEKAISIPHSPRRSVPEESARDEGVGAEREMNLSLRLLRQHNGVPLSATDPMRSSIEGTAPSLILLSNPNQHLPTFYLFITSIRLLSHSLVSCTHHRYLERQSPHTGEIRAKTLSSSWRNFIGNSGCASFNRPHG